MIGAKGIVHVSVQGAWGGEGSVQYTHNMHGHCIIMQTCVVHMLGVWPIDKCACITITLVHGTAQCTCYYNDYNCNVIIACHVSQLQ